MKDLKISKELVKSVLAKETEYLSDDFTFNIEDNYILFVDDGESQFEVNVYEFAFKCKEWAFKQGYEIHTNILEVVAIFKEVEMICNHGNFERIPLKSWQEVKYDIDTNSEVEAIIEACNWVLNEVSK